MNVRVPMIVHRTLTVKTHQKATIANVVIASSMKVPIIVVLAVCVIYLTKFVR